MNTEINQPIVQQTNSENNQDVNQQQIEEQQVQNDHKSPADPNLQPQRASNDVSQQSLSKTQTDPDQSIKPLFNQIKKKELDPFLKCSLCTGFFRDAHTINECLCSFCKGCIYKYFCYDPKRECCPKCNTLLGGKPLRCVISDTTLQKIVDLLYPQFKEQDQQTIRELYRTFQSTNPLPKDPSLIDYGFNIDLESEMIQKKDSDQHKDLRHRSRSRDDEETKTKMF